MSVREKELTTIGAVTTTDFVRTVRSEGSSTKALVATLAETIVENYTGSSLDERSRSVKSAIDSHGTSLVDHAASIEELFGKIEIEPEVITLYESLGWTQPT